MRDLVVLFSYHRLDPATQDHWSRVVRHNPDALVVPICWDSSLGLPGAVAVDRSRCRWDLSDRMGSPGEWLNADAIVYTWFEHYRVPARRYLYMEWDTVVELPWREYLSSVWEADVAAVQFCTPTSSPNWYWWRDVPLLPEPLQPHACGSVPLAVTLFSARALAEIVAHAPPRGFCELRVGTTAQRLGLDCQAIPGSGATIASRPEHIRRLDRPSVYHPVKTLDW